MWALPLLGGVQNLVVKCLVPMGVPMDVSRLGRAGPGPRLRVPAPAVPAPGSRSLPVVQDRHPLHRVIVCEISMGPLS